MADTHHQSTAARPSPLRLVAGPVEVLTASPPLRTRRLTLRALRPEDRDAYLAAARASREALDRYMPLHMEGETDEAMFARQLELARIGPSRDWLRFVCIQADGSVAGGVNLQSISRGLEWRADINIWIASPLAGRGLATEALTAASEHALADLPRGLGLCELHAWITRDNRASAALAARLGYTRSGEEKSYLLTDSKSWVLHDLWIRRAEALPTTTNAP